MKKIGIIGCGTIGSEIAFFIQKKLRKKARVVALCDIDLEKAKALSVKIKPRPVICNVDTLVRKSDLVVEAASVNASAEIAEEALSHKKDCLIMSSGGLLKKMKLLDKAEAKGSLIHIPSGAISGLDGLKAAAMGKIKSVVLTTRKPIKGLKGAPYLKGRDIERIKKETVLYSGNAEGAIKYFPKNINVAATLSLSGIGPRRTKVKIVTSPRYKRNIHEIEIVGESGRIFISAENVPSKGNPKTSQLAVFSALAKLKEIV